jgi:xylulokinase
MDFFGFDEAVIPAIQPLFGSHGALKKDVAERLSFTPGIPVTYKAGDQPNNAFSLNVLQPGEVAATAGTSGVIYGVSDNLAYDTQSRINSFAHVNHTKETTRIGVLLCINGCGIFNRWVKNTIGGNHSYDSLNIGASGVAAGSNGVFALPFGNGAERMLNNRTVGAHWHGLDFNLHTSAHLVRAAQEGIAFAFRYGLDIMRENGMEPAIIRAGRANMFLSDVFTQSFVNATGVPVELHQTDGSVGAALGAGVGLNFFKTESEAFAARKPLAIISPSNEDIYETLFQEWKALLNKQLVKQGSANVILQAV